MLNGSDIGGVIGLLVTIAFFVITALVKAAARKSDSRNTSSSWRQPEPAPPQDTYQPDSGARGPASTAASGGQRQASPQSLDELLNALRAGRAGGAGDARPAAQPAPGAAPVRTAPVARAVPVAQPVQARVVAARPAVAAPARAASQYSAEKLAQARAIIAGSRPSPTVSAPAAPPPPPAAADAGLRKMQLARADLVRAVLMSEVLGRPRALAPYSGPPGAG